MKGRNKTVCKETGIPKLLPYGIFLKLNKDEGQYKEKGVIT